MSIEPRRAAVVLGCAVVLVSLLGALEAWRLEWGREQLDLDGEKNLPAAFSALLLVAAAILVVRLPRDLVPRLVTSALAVVLVLAAFDEALELHERLERELDTDWQVLYIPVFAAVAVLWTWLLVALRRIRLSVTLLVASGACWLVSQVFEREQWGADGPEPGYTWMVVVEETLEMTGSALLVLALLVASDRVDDR